MKIKVKGQPQEVEVEVTVLQVAEADAIEKLNALGSAIDHVLETWNEGQHEGCTHDMVEMLDEVADLADQAERARTVVERITGESWRADAGHNSLNASIEQLRVSVKSITESLNKTRARVDNLLRRDIR